MMGLQWPGRERVYVVLLPGVRPIATALVPVAVPVYRAPAEPNVHVSVGNAPLTDAAAVITPAGVSTAPLVPVHAGGEIERESSDTWGHTQAEQVCRRRLSKLRWWLLGCAGAGRRDRTCCCVTVCAAAKRRSRCVPAPYDAELEGR